MNLMCIICSDLLNPSAELYSTHCGHIFHYACLVQWIERSKTCPQCRFKTTEKTIHRVFLNLAHTEGDAEDVSSLQVKYDNAQFDLRLKTTEVNKLKEKYTKMKGQNQSLRELISELEHKEKVNESVVHALKDQISYFKNKAKEKDKCFEDIGKLKMKIKQMEAVEAVINGSRSEVNEMLKSDNDVESLVMMVATLKKALLDVEKKKIHTEHKCKQLQSEITHFKRESSALESENKFLKQELELARKKNVYKYQIPKEKHKTVSSSPSSSKVESNSVPVLNRSDSVFTISDSSSRDVISLVDSPISVEEKIIHIKSSDSPYLCVKKTAVGIFENELGQRTIKPKQVSLFKRTAVPTSVRTCKSETVEYDGLGGQREKEIFPTSGAIKRHRFDPISSTSKLRKITFKK